MANYDYMMICPGCGVRDLNLLNYTSLMVIREDIGLFTLTCPNCNEKVSSIQPIPIELFPEVEEAAIKVNAGMGNSKQ